MCIRDSTARSPRTLLGEQAPTRPAAGAVVRRRRCGASAVDAGRFRPPCGPVGARTGEQAPRAR
eukprot:5694176-Alexandrium_andersonii.AAC.1